MDGSTMDIVFAIGDSYSQHCCVAIASILCNNPSGRFNFHILSDYLSVENKRKLDGLHEAGNYNIFFHTITQKDFESFDIVIPHTSIHTYYRYVIPEILPELQKCLYLDSDIVVNGSLAGLWDTNLEGFYAAGVADYLDRDTTYKARINMLGYTYVNAGVLLFNLNKMREDGMTARLISATPEIASNGEYQDQDVINYVFRRAMKSLPAKYNYTTGDSRRSPEMKKEAVIIHYTLRCKPWVPTCKSHHKMRRLYFKYLRMTPYAPSIREYRRARIKYGLRKLWNGILGKKQIKE